MSGMEEESYLDRLLSSIEQQEEEGDSVPETYEQSQDDDVMTAFAEAGIMSPLDIPEIEAEAFLDEDNANDVDEYIDDELSPSELMALLNGESVTEPEAEENIEQIDASDVIVASEIDVSDETEVKTQVDLIAEAESVTEEAQMSVEPQVEPQVEAEVEAMADMASEVEAEVVEEVATEEVQAEAMSEVVAEEVEVQQEEVSVETELLVQDSELEAENDTLEPDFSEPELSESDIQRLESMELDSLIEDVTSDSHSVEGLFDESELLQEQNSEKTVEDTIAETNDEPIAPQVQSDTLADAAMTSTIVAEEVKTVIEPTSVAPEIVSQDVGEIKSKKQKKAKKEKASKDKSKKGGLGAALKSIFFESTDSTTETEAAKKKGQKAAQEAKASAKEPEATLKETVVNEAGEKEIDENQKLLKEMYGKEREDEVAPKQGFFAKLKYRLSLFMKKSAEEDALEDAAEAKQYEEKQKIKAEKQEADKIKKEEAKAEKAKKAEEAKAKKEAKKKEKKPKPEPKPEDILKIKPKSMFLFILFVIGAIVLIIMLNDTFGYNRAISTAKASMENGNYAKAYEALSGMELKGNDVVMYEQASVIMYVERHYESYQNYKLMGRPTEALDALITGLVRYETYYMRAVDLGVDKQLIATRERILLEITDEYGISTTEAISLANLSQTDYTQYYIKVEAYGKAKQ